MRGVYFLKILDINKILLISDNWNSNEFEIFKSLKYLNSFENFAHITKFTIFCLEILIKVTKNPIFEVEDLNKLLSSKGYDIFLK